MKIGLGIGIPFSRSTLYKAVSSSLQLDFVSSQVLDPRITFTRASNATRVNSSGLIETVASNAPRFDYDPVTLAPKGLLIEEQRTNFCLRSSDIDSNAYPTLWKFSVAASIWTPVGTATAPDGSNSGKTYVVTPGSNAHTGYQDFVVTPNTTYTWTLLVKLGTLPLGDYKIAFRDDTAGVFIAADVIPTLLPAAGGWSKVVYTLTTPAGCTNLRCYPIRTPAPVTGGTISFWGAQLEAGSFPTSYIPTTTAAATRAADGAVMTGANFSSWYRQDEGTLFADATSPLATGYIWTLMRAGVGYGPRIQNTLNGVNVSYGAVVDNAGAVIVSFTRSGLKSAFALKTDDYALSANGGSVITDNSGAIPTEIAQLKLGIDSVGGTALNGHIRRIAYFPRRLSNAELQGITA